MSNRNADQRTEDITSDLAGVVCQPSRMASSFIRGQKTDCCVPLRGTLYLRTRRSRDNASVFCPLSSAL
ncbi:MAG: hypothetical protein HY936_11570 [Nitrosomonadales bacterium]|nr:hypothetical protein [Nitrosomonadales bacterium]